MNLRALVRAMLVLALLAVFPTLVLGCPAPQEEAPAVEEPASEEQPAPAPVEELRSAERQVVWNDKANKGCDQPNLGAECVFVDPTILIWKDKSKNAKRPQKVVWTVDQTELYWEFRFKGETGKNYIGDEKVPAPIDCGKDKTMSNKAKGDLMGDDLEWPYEITVWACKDDEKEKKKVKDPDKCLCKSDPMVIIKD